ncbi:MAG: HD domain-containing protein [Flavobacteriales bacterium]|nr:MAG: HD domain-containing protein [Flavobacteriales bacterium]
MNETKVINRVIKFVKKELQNAEGGHDWFHVERVYKNTLLISKNEKVDLFVVSLGALLHDIADAKFHHGDETIGPKIAREFLVSEGVSEKIIEQVVAIIENVSFKGGNKQQTYFSDELNVVQDADRLDAIGAIGIARCFNYGGFKNRKLYDPKVKPNLKLTPKEYKNSKAPTLNHFYEKLLLLKDKMNTKTGKKIAQNRHHYMEQFLKQFYKECDGEI